MNFWNYSKAYFTNKDICNGGRIILVENDEFLNKDSDIFETFNNYFVNIAKDLGIFDWADGFWDCSNILTQMYSFSNHPSIQMIRININIPLILNLNLLVLIKSWNLLIKLIVKKMSKIPKEKIAEPITNCIHSSMSTYPFSRWVKNSW